jgi:hypothetical protein
MVNDGIFYAHLEYSMTVWYNLWPVGRVCGHLLYFCRFGMFGPRKIWQTCSYLHTSALPTKVAMAALTTSQSTKKYSHFYRI